MIHQSINQSNVDIRKKQKIISFVGKLNSAKGYDIFCQAIIKILNKYLLIQYFYIDNVL